MTIYDLVYEEEQQDIYNLLLNPPKTVIDPVQNGINSENQVSFTCHVKRGTIDNNTSPLSYEYVQFNGYFSKSIFHLHYIHYSST
jgi:circadian locomoter output cycle kaput protein